MKRLGISILLVLAILAASCESPENAQSTAEEAQVKISKVEFNVTGMTCAECANTIDQTLTAVNGVETADVSFDDAHAVITYDASKTSVDDLRKAVEKVGYGVEVAKN